jgi:hypothetical protein
MFNNFSTIDWNIMKLTWCTPIHQGLSNGTKSMARGILVSIWQTNKQPSFVDRWCPLSQVQSSNSSRKKGSMKIPKKKKKTFHINYASYLNFKTNNSNKIISNEIPEKWNIEFTLTYDEHSSQCGKQINLLKKAFCFLHWNLSQTIVHIWYIWKIIDD